MYCRLLQRENSRSGRPWAEFLNEEGGTRRQYKLPSLRFGQCEGKKKATMLPRHVRRASSLIASNARGRLHVSNATNTHQRLLVALAAASANSTSSQQQLQWQSGSRSRQFHSSARRQDGPPKSPFQTFVDTLKEELQKNRDLQENVKQLQGDVDKFQDSEAMKRARAAYERARVRC